MQSTEYESKIHRALDALGISETLIREKKLPYHREARELALAESDANGVMHLLVPPAAKAWGSLKNAAGSEAIVLEIVSAFRSIEDQVGIIREKLDRGMPMQRILTLSAPPGFSEHHTGCAVDVNEPGCVPREEPFEQTDAFRWLTENAHRFGFTLSYPRGNASGFIYEPWHWFFREEGSER